MITASSEIVEENNYYPFGLKQKGYNNVVNSLGNSVAQKFGYNGIELEESLGLNLMEMDSRQYDSALGRFNGIDPVTHYDFSTFNAFDNNPILFADPSGADATTLVNTLWNKSGSGATTWTNNNGTFSDGNGNDVIVDPNGNEANFADDWYAAVDGNLVMTNGTDYQVWNPNTGKYEAGRKPKHHRGSSGMNYDEFPDDLQIGDTYSQYLYDPYGVLFTAAGDSRTLLYLGEESWLVDKDFSSATNRKIAASFMTLGSGLRWGGKLLGWISKFKAGKQIISLTQKIGNKLAIKLRQTYGGNVTVMKNGTPVFRVHPPGTHGQTNASVSWFRQGTSPNNGRTFNIPNKTTSPFDMKTLKILKKASKGKGGYSLKTRGR
ncbi:hypothetical protein TPENAI_30052 [Tenacibaculum litopenaei]|uniref:RHS repeat-associated core domain-containing protein n=1 Tax=Tenacibaculum litopenaei TaxID=396016 RepID=UPI0038959AAF